MKPSKHNNPDSWRRDDVNLRRALQQRNSNLPLLPEGFADRMKQRLEAETPAAPATTATNARRRHLWPIAAAALSTAAILALVFLIDRPTSNSRPMMAEQEAEAATPTAEQPAEPQQVTPVVPVTEATPKATPQPRPALLAEATATTEPLQPSETLETTQETASEPAPEAEPESTLETTPEQPEAAVDTPPDLTINPKRIRDYIGKADAKARGQHTITNHDEQHKTSRQLLALAVNVGADGGMNTVHNEAAIGSNSMEFSNAKPANYYFPAGNGYTYDTSLRASTYWAAAELYAKSLQSIDDSHHHMPLTFGVSIGIPLNRRFALESGITYTRLVSTFDRGTLGSYQHSRQQVHYLGIPLRAQALIFDRRHWNIYASLGGSIELPVGTLVTHSIISNADSKSLPDTHPTAPVQFAIGGGLGVQYSITRHLGIYAEPQLQWFIPTDSEITTYRTEHPLRFVPTLGLRWSL